MILPLAYETFEVRRRSLVVDARRTGLTLVKKVEGLKQLGRRPVAVSTCIRHGTTLRQIRKYCPAQQATTHPARQDEPEPHARRSSG